MRRRRGRVDSRVILAIAVLAILFYIVETRTRRTVRSALFPLKLEAAQISARAFRAVRDYRINKIHLPLDSVNDPNLTGLIGVHYSPITYGRTDLSDALTSTNPNLGAALIELFFRAGVKRGDTIAVNWDGTYPALNIQLLAAAKVLGVYPVIVTAQTAGMWGANYHPGFTWLEIERLLRQEGLWDYASVLATPGGEADNGRGLPYDARGALDSGAKAVGVPLFVPESIGEGVARRNEVFRRCRLLVAIGHPVSNSGDPAIHLPTGLLTGRHRKAGTGVVAGFLSRGLPVIHIASPRVLATRFRLPVAPVPLPEPGKGRLFYEHRYSVTGAVLLACVLLGLLFLVIRYDVEYYFGVKGEDEGEAV